MNEFLLFGLIGGALPDILRMVNNRYQPALPGYLRSGNFYVGFVLLLLLGMATVQWLDAGSATEALSYGYSAPQVISGLLGNFAKSARSGSVKRNQPLIPEEQPAWGLLDFWKR